MRKKLLANVHWIRELVRPYRFIYWEVILCSFLINMLVLSVPVFTMNVYDRVINYFSEATLIALSLGVMIALLFDLALKLVRIYLLEQVGMRVSHKADVRFMRLILAPSQKIQSQLPRQTGNLAVLFRELQQIREFYASGFVPTLIDLCFFMVFMLIVYWIAGVLVVIPITIALLILSAHFMSYQTLNRLGQNTLRTLQYKTARLYEFIRHRNAILLHNGQDKAVEEWEDITAETSMHHSKLALWNRGSSFVVFYLTQMMTVSLVIAGAYQIHNQELTIGALVATTIMSSRAISPFVGLSEMLAKFHQSRISMRGIEKLLDMLDEQEKAYEDTKNHQLLLDNPSIECRHIYFSYPDAKRAALKDCSLTIQHGESIGVVGRTGAGKTTLAHTLGGLLAVEKGNLLLNGYDMANIPMSILRKHIGVADQNPAFFSGTILQNINLSNEEIPADWLKQVMILSGVDECLRREGLGYDAHVSEGGENLSGGQRQCISIARALIHNPEILILDEPTNAMDHLLEQHVTEQLATLAKKKTFILITHRLQLLQLVDRLLFVEKGSIIADDKRDNILEKLQKGS